MESKSKTTAGLLGIFLGWIGIHNFYLGYKKKAIIQCCVGAGCIVLGAIMWMLAIILSFIVIGVIFYPIAMLCNLGSLGIGIWGFVEGIMVLTGKIAVDGNGNELVP